MQRKNTTDNNNLFDPRFGKRPAFFVGREDVLRDIRAALNDTDDAEKVLILTGIKGSGKSSILAEIHAGLDTKRVVSADTTTEGDLSALLSGLCRLDKDAVIFLDDVSRDTPGLRPFLIGFARQFHQGEGLMLILAGLPHEIDELLKDRELSFLRKARRYTLGNVRVDEVIALYKEVFGFKYAQKTDLGGLFTAERALIRAAEATGGYPYLIQLIGYYLSREDKIMDNMTADQAADKAIFLAKIELYKNLHDPLVGGLSSKDRMFLWAMAQDESHSEFGDIAKRMNVSAGYASKYRERLINAGVIYRSAYGELSFTLPFMREYIEKEFIERLGGEGGKRRL